VGADAPTQPIASTWFSRVPIVSMGYTGSSNI